MLPLAVALTVIWLFSLQCRTLQPFFLDLHQTFHRLGIPPLKEFSNEYFSLPGEFIWEKIIALSLIAAQLGEDPGNHRA